MTTQNKLIIIGGYGRSGSTILDIALARKFGAFSLGELRYARSHIDNDTRTCSCGCSFDSCSFWSRYHTASLLTGESTLRSMSVITSIRYLLNKSIKQRVRALYIDLFSNISNTNIAIDSSKTARGAFLRPFVVAFALGKEFDISYIGIFRHPNAVLGSLKKGSNESMASNINKVGVHKLGLSTAPVLKLVFGWSYANISLLMNYYLLRLIGREAKVYSHEYFSSNFDEITFPGFTDQKSANSQLHLIGGNRLAFDSDVQIVTHQDVSDSDNSLFERSIVALVLPIYGLLKLVEK